eukprot:1619050-Pleurochrysis_carterae.AAC.3
MSWAAANCCAYKQPRRSSGRETGNTLDGSDATRRPRRIATATHLSRKVAAKAEKERWASFTSAACGVNCQTILSSRPDTCASSKTAVAQSNTHARMQTSAGMPCRAPKHARACAQAQAAAAI